jgi:chemosensory pili system protein ChpC
MEGTRLAGEPDFVRSLYMQLYEDGLLLPIANVAEIVAFAQPCAYSDAQIPPWIAGHVGWRGKSLPICALEASIGATYQPPSVRGRIVVLHGITGSSRLAFFGVIIQELPVMVLASSASVHWIPSKVNESVEGNARPHHEFVSGWVDAAGRDAWIPDLTAIETEVAASMT